MTMSDALSKLPNWLKKPRKRSEQDGWEWRFNPGSKHVSVFDANGEFVVCLSLTAYDGSVTRKVRGKLKRAGCPGLPA
jgi:hypothetical protein